MSSRSPILDMKHKLAFGMEIPCRRNDFHTKHTTLFLPRYCVVFFLQAVSSSFFLRSLTYASRIQLLRSFKQDCIPVGCVPPARWPYLPACSTAGGISALGGGVCSWGVSDPGIGGVCFGGCLLPGGSAPRGIPACTEADPPSPVNRITYACENITLPQLRCGW